MRVALVAAATAALAVPGPLSVSAHSAPTDGERTALAPLRLSAKPVPGQYIVRLKPVSDVKAAAKGAGVTPLFSFSKLLRGFAAKLTDAQLAEIRALPEVQDVEQDAEVTALDAGPGRAAPAAPTTAWGLDRIDQRALPLDGGFTARATGARGNAYILDTGIDYRHAEFQGRAVPGFDAFPGEARRGADCQGHGTHVAGTIGGRTYGVARQAGLISVRVLDCEGSGSNSGVIAGLEWAASHAALHPAMPGVLNASLGGPKSDVLNDAVDALALQGTSVVVAAGNSAQDACEESPASAEHVVTTGATDSLDQETSFSNWGPCVRVYAPGKNIVSAKMGGGSVALSGTSMASPHVAGTALLYRTTHPAAAPEEVAGWISANSTKDVIKPLHATSPNRILFTNGI